MAELHSCFLCQTIAKLPHKPSSDRAWHDFHTSSLGGLNQGYVYPRQKPMPCLVRLQKLCSRVCRRSAQGTTPHLFLAPPDHCLSEPWHLSVGLITLADTQGGRCSFMEQVGQKHAVKAWETSHPRVTNELQPWPKSRSRCWTPGPCNHGLRWTAKENNHLWCWFIITVSDNCNKDFVG